MEHHQEIVTTNGHKVLIDEVDYSHISPFRWAMLNTGYAAYSFTIDGTTNLIYMHRLISSPPLGKEVDHVNGCTWDNRRANLRWATRAQNATNFWRENETGYRGVQRTESGRYVAKIVHNKQQIHLGRYDTAEEAAKAYDKAATLYQGEFALRNFVERT